MRRKSLSLAGKVLRRHSLDHTIVFGAPEQDPRRIRLRRLTGENQTEESTSNGGNLPGPPSEGFHSPESVQHPAFYRYQESLKPRSLYVVFLVEIDMRVERC